MNKEIQKVVDSALFNFYLEADKNSISETINESVSNLDSYNKVKKKSLFLLKAAISKKRNEYLLYLVDKFQDAIINNIERPISLLKELIQSNQSFALYNSLNKLSKDDIIDIIKDKNLVELLEKLDNNSDVI